MMRLEELHRRAVAQPGLAEGVDPRDPEPAVQLAGGDRRQSGPQAVAGQVDHLLLGLKPLERFDQLGAR